MTIEIDLHASLRPLVLAFAALACSSTGTTNTVSESTSNGGTSTVGGVTNGPSSSSGTVGTSTIGNTAANSSTVNTDSASSGTVGNTSSSNTVDGGMMGTGTIGTSAGGSGGGTAATEDGSSTDGATTGSGTTGGNTEPCTGSGSLAAGDSEHSLTVGGNTYPFNVHAPPGYDGVTRLPVVFDFHGLGGNEDQMKNLSGWASTGDEQGFITVFPGGVDNAWNAGGCCSDTATDVEFVREAITYLDTEGCIDTKRIYASGCSNGGAMSYRLACEAADVIAAVAPVDFDCVVGGGCGSCSPSRPVTEIQFRGTNDTLVNYNGAEPNFERWGEINECSGTTEPLPENSSCERHTMCADGVESILCTVQNGSHCGSYSSFGIADLAWEIISRYSLP